MPTPKQVRYHFSKVDKLISKLENAMWQAQDAKVIVYKDAATQSPGNSLSECYSRFIDATKDQLAQAMREEIRKDV